ncbi:MAG: 2-oxoacid:ferredoxin oxidoreductase subunit gamma [Candidatus Bathyarchaeota archaeon]|nr:2-oxoacid:ferredoxin oxidoreductase subunit gamma [Candidatus Bathyarchaeota archaeon]
MRTEVRFAGFGGQGIIRSGLILSMAACIYSEKNAVLTQSYGPESRGGSCKSEVVISDEEIDYPKVDDPDITVVMSQEAYHKYSAGKKGGIVLLDPDMVKDRDDSPGLRIYEVPATKIAKEVGKAIVANVVMLGALTAVAELVTPEALKKAVTQNVPAGTEELNTLAFKKGYEYGKYIRRWKSMRL